MTQALLYKVLDSSPNWSRGQNLSLLHVDEFADEIETHLRAHLAKLPRRAVGALLLLWGAWKFGQRADGPFDWSVLAGPLGQPVNFYTMWYDAIEIGAREHLGIPILRSNAGRRFIGTMLRHSGASRATVACALEIVAKLDAWPLLAENAETIADWLNSVRDHYTLRGSDRAVLAMDEGRLGIAARLRVLAAIRERFADPGTKTWEALEARFGNALRDAFEDDDDDFVRRISATLFDFAPLDRMANRFTWRDRDGQLFLTFPEGLELDLTPTIDRVRLCIEGVQPVVYTRSTQHFQHIHGERQIAAPADHPVMVVLQMRNGDAVEEQLFAALEPPPDVAAVAAPRRRRPIKEVPPDVQLIKYGVPITVDTQDISILSGAVSVRVFGTQHQTASVIIATPDGRSQESFQLVIPRAGRKDLPLSRVRSDLLSCAALEIDVHWPMLGEHRSLGRFANARAERPVVGSMERCVRWPHPIKHPAIRAFPAAQPWAGITTFEVTVRQDGAEVWLDWSEPPADPWIAALFDGEERVSGCWLINPEIPPPPHLGQLETALWAGRPTIEAFRAFEPEDRRAWLEALAEKIVVFGALFVKWSPLFAQLASDELLRVLTDHEPSTLIRSAFRELGTPRLAVTLAHLDLFAATEDDLTEPFIALATQPLGLAVAAFRRWGDRLDLQRVAPYLARDTTSSNDHLAAEPDLIPATTPWTARLTGMVEAHQLTRRDDWSDLVRQFRFTDHTARVDAVDARVAELARAIVEWRAGDGAWPPSTRELYAHVPHLFDHWLNALHEKSP